VSVTYRRPVAIDLFSGVGGLSLGLEQAGFDVAAAVELDPIHACAHAYNFPGCAVIPTSVVGLSGRQIRQRAGLDSADVDLVAGGPPCQGFSMIGQRALDDPRNSLVLEFVRLVNELGAKYFIFENVKGLTVGAHKQFLQELIRAFERSGYVIAQPWQVLNASSFGVPQDRQRLFLLGSKRGLPELRYPDPATRAAGTPSSAFELQEGPSCADALADLPNAEDFAVLLDTDAVIAKHKARTSKYAQELRCMDTTGWHFGYRRQWNSSELTSSTRTRHSTISRRRFSQTKQGEVEPISRFFKLPADRISNTLRAGTDSARGAFTSPRPIHYKYPRCITVREMARLHGFPDWFRFHATKWHGARQIGNAVAPPLARAVATQVMTAMRAKPIKPSSTVDLGPARLLQVGMKEAAEHWGVVVPIRGRDRKSGARKRSQLETEHARLEATGSKPHG
jgi:DNA (cytosine-5)-methyltransferase 1